jgi:DNA repair protein RecN (Recombination protein N)
LPMLQELRVENLLLIDRAELALAPGLNVVTGETGAGKTLLAQALDLLLGARPPRAGSGVVRAGAAEAYVEGVFSLPPELADLELLPTGAEEIVLARRVWPDGRTRAYVCGRSATVADLRELGSALLAFYGQHEHRKLMLAAVQMDVLDGFCGEAVSELRARVGDAYSRVRAVEARETELRELAAGRERELDLLAFELDEIESVAPTADEAAELAVERDRLRHLETLRVAAFGGAEAISPEDGGGGAAELLAQAAAQLAVAAGIDPELAGLSERAQALGDEASELSGALRSYVFGLEASPGRLEEVEERLAQFARLERKHGGGIAEVLAHAERCRARRAELERAEIALSEVEASLGEARASLDGLAEDLTGRRREAAPALAAAVRERLAELAMPDAEFDVEVRRRPEGCGARGADEVSLVIAPNPGMPAGPLREIASGGELSRVMLALKTSVEAGDPNAAKRREAQSPTPRKGREKWGRQRTLVFDEIDTGIGGRAAEAVGKKLKSLARSNQVLCVTHLPQIATFGDHHYVLEKKESGGRSRTGIRAVTGGERTEEVARMLSGAKLTETSRKHAEQMIKANA